MWDMHKAASYARRSRVWKKGQDNKDSIEQQEAENIERAEEEGWEVVCYRDNDISARKDTVRDDWLRLNRDIESGYLDILILWESSRGDREAGDWINFLEKCKQHKLLIHITTDERTYNLDKIADWESLAIEGVRNQVEVLKTQRRVTRHMKDRAKKGLPHSRAPYGYEIYAISPKENGRRPVQPEADIAKEVITRVSKSEALVAIVKDLNSRGIDCPSVAEAKRAEKEPPESILRKGRQVEPTFRWSTRMMRKICTNVAYIGKRQYETELVDAQWEAIVDEETFWSAYNVLMNPERKTTKPGKAKHLLSTLMRCGECGSYVGRKKRGTEERYQCVLKGCVTMRMAWVDDFITRLTCARLAKPDVFDHILKRDNSKLHTELARLKGEHQQALDLRSKGKLSLIALSQEEDRLLPRIKELELQLTPASIPSVVRDLRKDATGNAELIRKRWEALEVPAQKEVLRTLYDSIKLLKATATFRRGIGEALNEAQIARNLKERIHIEWK